MKDIDTNAGTALKGKIAIYGGSFDPIHKAHVTLADTAVKELGLDELYFMPAFVSPFKQDKQLSSAEDRSSMIASILHYNPAFRLSNYEIMNGTTSYTIETLRHCASLIDGELYFILGFDSLVEVDTWFHGDEILKKYHLVSNIRPGTNKNEGLAKIEEFKKEYNASIHLLNMKPMKISGTEIRKRAMNGEDFSEFVCPEVEEYIIEHQLYK